MVNDLRMQYPHDEMERNAYNAAFYELGFRWHWDRDTYSRLVRISATPEERLQLLPGNAAGASAEGLRRGIPGARDPGEEDRAPPARNRADGVGHFDWTQARGCELGA